MKGLLIKDIGYLGLSKRIYGIMLIVIVLIMFTRGSGSSNDFLMSFMTSYIGIIFGIQVITTIAYDEMNGGLAYILAMPVSRKMYVYSKYLYAVLCALAGTLTGYILSIIYVAFGTKGLGALDVCDSLAGACMVIGVVIIIEAVMIPVQFYFGTEKGKLAIFILVALILLGSFAMERVGSSLGIDNPADAFTERLTVAAQTLGMAGTIAAGVGIVSVITVVSLLISNRIVGKKEF